MPSIYDYTDYRRFLSDKYLELKKTNAKFSYRFFNRLAGVKSSGFLKLVMDGKRNLARDGIRMITRGFRMSESEARYFEALVHFNQASSHEEKEKFFRELSQNKRFSRAKPLTTAQYNLFSHWYYVAIIEAVRMETPSKKDIGWLHKHLRPVVGIRELKKALKDLQAMDLLEEDRREGFRRKETMLSTPDEVQSLAVTNFHIQMSQLAGQAVVEQNHLEREFSSLTVVTSAAALKKAKEEIQQFRKKLHSILEQESEKKDRVTQINLHLFQLTGGNDP